VLSTCLSQIHKMTEMCFKRAPSRLALCFRCLPLIMLLVALGCGRAPSRPEDGRAPDAGTVTAWALKGTVFPELDNLKSAQPSPAAPLATPAPLPSQTSAQPEQSSLATPLATRPASALATPSPGASGLTETVGRIAIPSLGIEAPIVEVSWHLEQIGDYTVAVWDTVADAGGHHRGSAALGAVGNCVISGHSGAREGAVFNRVWELQPGDLIQITNNQGAQFSYVVDRVDRIQELGQPLAQRLANAAVMGPTDDSRLTLITCWPNWAYTHRVIVVARAP